MVTDSNGLIGSEVVEYFDAQGWKIFGIDNNMRASFFGAKGDTRWNQKRLEANCRNFVHHELDIRDRTGVAALIQPLQPDMIVHAAAQPSHDLAAKRPFDDFDINASDLSHLKAEMQSRGITRTLDDIFEELVANWHERL